jgi:hypothetical protein
LDLDFVKVTLDPVFVKVHSDVAQLHVLPAFIPKVVADTTFETLPDIDNCDGINEDQFTASDIGFLDTPVVPFTLHL